MSDRWFCTRELETGVWLLAEPSHVNTWLVVGDERAVLLDTGLGIAPIGPVARQLTGLPVEVVNTHYHFDHTGGNHEFDQISIHELGAPLLQEAPPKALLDGYLDYVEGLLDAATQYRHLDRRFFHLLTEVSDPCMLPQSFDRNRWEIKPTQATALLRDGDQIDLGGRSLTVIHTPGHSPDSISLLDEAAGLLFAGDTINTGPIYAQFPDSDLDAFAKSTARLAELASDVRLVLVHHFGRVAAEPQFLRDVAAGFRLLRAGLDLERAQDCIGNPVLEASFESFSILIADNEAAPVLSPGDPRKEEARA